MKVKAYNPESDLKPFNPEDQEPATCVLQDIIPIKEEKPENWLFGKSAESVLLGFS